MTTSDEMDSYMYQTVGQDAIEIVAAAMDLPLVRRVIQGTALEQRADYGSRETLNSVLGDETEDLYCLLQDVLVSVGPDHLVPAEMLTPIDSDGSRGSKGYQSVPFSQIIREFA